jgi:hypothetical protein
MDDDVYDVWMEAVRNKKRGGLEPIPDQLRQCSDPEHRPPTHISIPNGMQYRHICPTCGLEQVLRPIKASLHRLEFRP